MKVLYPVFSFLGLSIEELLIILIFLAFIAVVIAVTVAIIYLIVRKIKKKEDEVLSALPPKD